MREKILRSLVARIFMQQTREKRFVDSLAVRLCYCLSVACHVQLVVDGAMVRDYIGIV